MLSGQPFVGDHDGYHDGVLTVDHMSLLLQLRCFKSNLTDVVTRILSNNQMRLKSTMRE